MRQYLSMCGRYNMLYGVAGTAHENGIPLESILQWKAQAPTAPSALSTIRHSAQFCMCAPLPMHVTVNWMQKGGAGAREAVHLCGNERSRVHVPRSAKSALAHRTTQNRNNCNHLLTRSHICQTDASMTASYTSTPTAPFATTTNTFALANRQTNSGQMENATNENTRASSIESIHTKRTCSRLGWYDRVNGVGCWCCWPH